MAYTETTTSIFKRTTWSDSIPIPVKSRTGNKSACQTLLCLDLVDFPLLSRIKPQAPLLLPFCRWGFVRQSTGFIIRLPTPSSKPLAHILPTFPPPCLLPRRLPALLPLFDLGASPKDTRRDVQSAECAPTSTMRQIATIMSTSNVAQLLLATEQRQ